MMTTAESIPDYEILHSYRIYESVKEGSFPAIGIGSVGIHKGGGLDRLLDDAKEAIAMKAGDLGGNGIVGLRYELRVRDLEKSVLVYGTVVKCRKLEVLQG